MEGDGEAGLRMDFQLRELAIRAPGAFPTRRQRFVAQHVFQVEAKIFRREGLAIGPLMPFAQVDGVGGLVVAGLDALGDVGDDGRQVGIDGEQFLQARLERIPAAANGIRARAGQLAAIDADAFQRIDDCRFARQALGRRRHTFDLRAVEAGDIRAARGDPIGDRRVLLRIDLHHIILGADETDAQRQRRQQPHSQNACLHFFLLNSDDSYMIAA